MLHDVEILHDEAVSELVSLIGQKREVTFKSPTGSGKTYMMADFMDRILAREKDVIFIVSSLSKSNLAGQNYDKFLEYQAHGEFMNISPYLINSDVSGEETLFIPTDYNVYVLPRDLYKEDSLLMRGPMVNFLQTVTSNLYGNGMNKRIYLIKDECHIATNNLDALSDLYFSKTLNCSATLDPKKNQRPDVVITEEQAINAKLIKEVEWSKSEEVSEAIDLLDSIRDNYIEVLKVRPCLIIQISNTVKGETELATVYKELAKHPRLKWMYIVGDKKKYDTNDSLKEKNLPTAKWQDYAKENTSTIDVIIFKMVITEGWDIPRACMLFQSRDSRSKQLDEQVVGRVRRNPRLKDFEKLSPEAQELAMKAWVWGVKKKTDTKIYTAKLYEEPSDITDIIKIKTTVLLPITKKKGFNLDKFIETQPANAREESIFTRYRKLKKADTDVQQMCQQYTDGSILKWFTFTKHIDNIIKENNKFVCDYAQSMELAHDEDGEPIEVSFPVESTYIDNGEKHDETIKDWVWKNKVRKTEIFSFDSLAERLWACILRDLVKDDTDEPGSQRIGKNIMVGKTNPNAGQLRFDGTPEPQKINPTRKYLWGKNFIANSRIKYEYCYDGIHSSYPDFVMEDCYGRIHLFEVKSVNSAKRFDEPTAQEYHNKIMHLSECYKQASLLTGHIFYLPLRQEDTWIITRFMNGDKTIMTQETFEQFMKESKVTYYRQFEDISIRTVTKELTHE